MRISYTANREAKAFSLDQTWTVPELLFCVVVALPGIYIWYAVAENHWWGALSTIVFGWLAFSNLPPCTRVTVAAADSGAAAASSRSIVFARKPNPFLPASLFAERVASADAVVFQRKEVEGFKGKKAYQLMVGFKEGYGIPTSNTLVTSDDDIRTMRAAGRALAHALDVPYAEIEEDKSAAAAAASARARANAATAASRASDDDEGDEEDDVSDEDDGSDKDRHPHRD